MDIQGPGSYGGDLRAGILRWGFKDRDLTEEIQGPGSYGRSYGGLVVAAYLAVTSGPAFVRPGKGKGGRRFAAKQIQFGP